MVRRLSCSTAFGIFLDQGSNPCPLLWQKDSYPLGHQQNSSPKFKKKKKIQWTYFISNCQSVEGNSNNLRIFPLCFNLLLLFSHQVMSDSSWPHELQHASLPCPSLSPGVCLNLCPLIQGCHPTVSSSVIPFGCPPSFPASESFPMSRLFASGGQKSIGSSASVSVLLINIKL